MDDFKSIFSSKTFWGGLLAIVAGVLGFFGYTMGTEDQAMLVDSIAAVAAAVGGVIAIWGRVKASKVIGKPQK